jgi:hypothetical protein
MFGDIHRAMSRFARAELKPFRQQVSPMRFLNRPITVAQGMAMASDAGKAGHMLRSFAN